MSIFTRLRSHPAEKRSTLDTYAEWIDQQLYAYGGVYGQPWVQTWGTANNTEAAPGDYIGNSARLRSSGPLFTLMAIRLRLFSQVRWSYQQMRSGRPGDLFSNAALDIVNDDPCLNQWMIRDVDLAGNFYGKIENGRVWRMRPDWVQVIGNGRLDDYDTEILGYLYFPGGPGKTKLEDAESFLANEVIHWAPEPDPDARWRGMSWLSPVIREAMSDSKMTIHKEKYLDNAATANMIVKFDKDTSFENFEKFQDAFEADHAGTRNAYKTLFLGGGADATVVGNDLSQMSFTSVQGKGETRLANAAGVHPVVAGFSEGMQGSSLNAGNFGQARRSTADTLLHPLWVSAAAAIGTAVPAAADARVWYDARDVPFLREDAKDDAEIRATEAQTIEVLVREGFEPKSVIDAVTSGDFKRLVHTGYLSVQLWLPGVDSAKQPVAGAGTTSKPANSTAGRQLQLVIDGEQRFDGEVIWGANGTD